MTKFTFYFSFQKVLSGGGGWHRLWLAQCFPRLTPLRKQFRDWDGLFCTASFAGRLLHSKAKLPCWEQVMENWSYLLGLLSQVLEHFLKLNWGLLCFNTCQRGGFDYRGKTGNDLKIRKSCRKQFLCFWTNIAGFTAAPRVPKQEIQQQKRTVSF